MQVYDAAIIKKLIETPVEKLQHRLRVLGLDTEANYGTMVGVGVAMLVDGSDRDHLLRDSFELLKSDDLTSEMVGIVIRQAMLAASIRERMAEAREEEGENEDNSAEGRS